MYTRMLFARIPTFPANVSRDRLVSLSRAFKSLVGTNPEDEAMGIKHNQIHEESMDILEVQGDNRASAEPLDYETEIEVPNDAEHAVVLFETIRGDVNYEYDGIHGDNLSRTEDGRVRLFIFRVRNDARVIRLRISAAAGSRFRASVAFFKRAIREGIERLPCKSCKLLCRILISSMLAHLGIPFIEPQDAVSMPGVPLPPRFPGGGEWTLPAPTIEVMGDPVSLANCKDALVELTQGTIDGSRSGGGSATCFLCSTQNC